MSPYTSGMLSTLGDVIKSYQCQSDSAVVDVDFTCEKTTAPSGNNSESAVGGCLESRADISGITNGQEIFLQNSQNKMVYCQEDKNSYEPHGMEDLEVKNQNNVTQPSAWSSNLRCKGEKSKITKTMQ